MGFHREGIHLGVVVHNSQFNNLLLLLKVRVNTDPEKSSNHHAHTPKDNVLIRLFVAFNAHLVP